MAAVPLLALWRMHMRFTDEELLTLAEMLTLACWSTFWNNKPGSDDGVARYDALLDKVLERLQHNGQGNEVEQDPDRPQQLRLRRDREDKSFHAQCYDEMRNQLFWEELVVRLAERELTRKIGETKFNTLNEDERTRRLEPISKRLWSEFTDKGISNLHIVARLGDG